MALDKLVWILAGLVYGIPLAIILIAYLVKTAIVLRRAASNWYADMSDLVNYIFRR